jgi:hypothetical protein
MNTVNSSVAVPRSEPLQIGDVLASFTARTGLRRHRFASYTPLILVQLPTGGGVGVQPKA